MNILDYVKAIMTKKITIIGRSACLTHEILKLKYGRLKRINFINQQKVRADVFLEYLAHSERPSAEFVSKFLARKDISPLILQQETLPWLKVTRDIDLIIVDSYSELTDQKFRHKYEGWSFCCNYSDIEHDNEFGKFFECEGLLNLEKIERIYNEFFDSLQSLFFNKPILFVHFPTSLDKRQSFKQRGQAISLAVNQICKYRENIYNLYIDDSLVFPASDSDKFPYHYSQETYKFFVKEMNRILCF